MRTRQNKQTGFTIIELMITIGMISVLVGVAVPAMNVFLAKQSVNTKKERMGIALRLARSEALSRVRNVAVQWNSSAVTANVDFDGDGTNDYVLPAGAAIVFDEDGDADPVIQLYEIFDTKYTYTISSGTRVSFDPLGIPQIGGSDVVFTFCHGTDKYSLTQKTTGQINAGYKIEAC
jgi:type IV fimbrial biogenesis protein FimT